MASVLKIAPEHLDEHAILTELVQDSFILVDLIIEMQEEFDVIVVQDDLADVKTVGDLLTVFEERSART